MRILAEGVKPWYSIIKKIPVELREKLRKGAVKISQWKLHFEGKTNTHQNIPIDPLACWQSTKNKTFFIGPVAPGTPAEGLGEVFFQRMKKKLASPKLFKLLGKKRTNVQLTSPRVCNMNNLSSNYWAGSTPSKKWMSTVHQISLGPWTPQLLCRPKDPPKRRCRVLSFANGG